MNLLYPRITLRQFGWMFVFGLAGSVIAGLYGILDDQVTFRLGPEYFTKFKFDQFYYLDRKPVILTVAKIGFLATWWVGMFAGWFMGRITLPHEPVKIAARRSLRGVGMMVGIALLFAVVASQGSPRSLDDARIAGWKDLIYLCNVEDPLVFIQVGYIHNASYLGGLVGLIAALIWLRLTRRRALERAAVTRS